MKIGELKDLLSVYNDDLEVKIVVNIKDECNCGEYCYCSYHDTEFYISDSVSEQIDFNTKTKKQELVGVVLRGE